ncbi:MAG: feruloyl-CoA synthase [Candidatus Acidiferrales bacterium]|jgi:feruloyl-CoA synthase
MSQSSHQRELSIARADLRRHEPHSSDGNSTAAGRSRPVRLRTSGVTMQTLADGTILVRPDEALRPYPKALTDRVIHWANVAPERCCIAKRGPGDEWRRLTYSQVMESAKRLGQALLDRGLSVDRPVAILSENDLEHFLLMLAGQHVGISTAHISPVYSLVSKDFAKLRHALNLLTPGLVFVSDGKRYSRAIEAAVEPGTEVLVTHDPSPRPNTKLFAKLLATEPTPAVEAAHARIDPDDPAKFLFTSGSTGSPKGVINTHRMICSNLEMIAQVFGFLEDRPPVIVDWLPWNHTFGGNHNVGISLYNGGTFYIDEGKPGVGFIDETIRNLREISPTVYFNVPKGYEDLLPALRADTYLRENFFRNLELLFYAGAGLSQPVWDEYRRLALDTCGERIVMVTGLGATETAPMAIQTTWETDHSGVIGVPIPGVEMKLVPRGHKLEVRVRGSNITPGYWRQPELTKKVFDDEGFYIFGDALRFVDPTDVNKGFYFDGRFSEDFKLASGTWVSVGPLRAKILSHFTPYVRDAVIAGHDRDEVGMLLFADHNACCTLCPTLSPDLPAKEIFRHEKVRSHFRALLASLSAEATGSSNRVVRAILVEEPPSLDAGEITDKGSLNQRAVLERRAALVEELYAAEPSPAILRINRI